MLKVSLSGRPLRFISSLDQTEPDKNIHIFEAKSSSRMLAMIRVIESHETQEDDRYYVLSEQPLHAQELFLKNFRLIEAAGGLVKNKEGRILMIYRNMKWDLPKGKIEKGEDKKAAALREVEEECGVKMLRILRPLTDTYHTYALGKERILKRTYWYEMDCSDTSELIPQLEEGITDARWMSEDELKEALKNTFANIRDVVEGIT